MKKPVKLSVVVDNPPPPVVDPLAGYEPLLLSTPGLIDMYWAEAAVHLERSTTDEFTVDDIHKAVLAGKMYVFIFKKDGGEMPDVALALALELVMYPRFVAMNIVALGGTQLRGFHDKFWGRICSWAYMNGVRTMQASGSPAMVRIMKTFGFKSVYTVMRMDLTEI